MRLKSCFVARLQRYFRTFVSVLFHASWFYFRIYLYFSQWSKVFVQFVNHWCRNAGCRRCTADRLIA